MRRRVFVVLIFAVIPVLLSRFAAAQAPLQPVAKLTMPASVQGRFDHLGIDEKGSRLFVAAESAHQVLVFDLKSGKYVRSIPNIQIPHAIFVGSRSGAISVFDTGTGKELTSLPIGGGVDDMVFEAGSKRLYATCGGDGLIYVYQQRDADHYELAGKVPSGQKGKNGLLSRPRGRFYVIVPPQGSTPGAVYVFAVQS